MEDGVHRSEPERGGTRWLVVIGGKVVADYAMHRAACDAYEAALTQTRKNRIIRQPQN